MAHCLMRRVTLLCLVFLLAQGIGNAQVKVVAELVKAVRALKGGEPAARVIDGLRGALITTRAGATGGNIPIALVTRDAIRALEPDMPRDEMIARLQRALVEETYAVAVREALNRPVGACDTAGRLAGTCRDPLVRQAFEEIRAAAARTATDTLKAARKDFCRAADLCQLQQQIQDLLDSGQNCDAESRQGKTREMAKAKAEIERLAQESSFWWFTATGVSVAECIKTQSICDCLGLVEKVLCGEPSSKAREVPAVPPGGTGPAGAPERDDN